jgi:phosphoribosyl 1,2-cyclic phosphodiesterase
MFFLRFWGVRGSISVARPDMTVYGGHTTCIEIRAGKRLLIIDCGTGIYGLGNSLMGQKSECVNADIFFTHSHFDHIEGFLMFKPFFVKKNTFRIHGPRSRSGRNIEETISSVFSPDYWPVGLSDITAKLEWRDIQEGVYDMGDGLVIKSQFLEHPAPNLGYRFEYGGKSIALVFDHEGYSARNAKIVSFLKDADLAVLDSQYTEAEYYKCKQSWGHNSFEKVIATAEEAGVRDTLLFFHHDPDRTDAQLSALEKKYARQTKIKNVYAAKENAVYEI